jgi:TolB-like protein/tetratricopeptide (TPR) repeat protein
MPEKRLAAVMFTDIVGYSTLMGSDEDQAFELLKRNRVLHNSIIGKFNGSLIKEMGDGILISFPLVSDAVRCAVELQTESEKQNIPLKIGIHEGEMVFEGNDVLGDGVNVASRLQEIAKRGNILISGNVYNNIKNKTDIQTRSSGNKKLKNINEPVGVYEVLYKNEGGPEEINSKITRKIVYYVAVGLLVLTVIFIVFRNFFADTDITPTVNKEKSIAVLPFDNESDDKSNEYFVNGMMEEIRNNLSAIGDLRVISKTSTEKYRSTTLLTTEIGNELNVNYLLEGTVQRSGNKVRIHAQLIDTEIDDHIWAETYTRELNDVFTIQSEISVDIANKLYANITPVEIEIIETPPTTNLTAYDYYLQGRNEHSKYWLNYGNTEALEKAIILYRKALDNDTTFAKSYTGLARAYLDKHYQETLFKENFLDTIIHLANIALSFDNKLAEAYGMRATYYLNAQSDVHKALEETLKAINYDPNYAQAYDELSNIYQWFIFDYRKAIENQQKAIVLDPGPFTPIRIWHLGQIYEFVGLYDRARDMYKKRFDLDQDTLAYYQAMAGPAWCEGDWNNRIYWLEKMLEIHPTNIWALNMLVNVYAIIGNIKEAEKYLNELPSLDQPTEYYGFILAYVLKEKGQIQQANEIMTERLDYLLMRLEHNRLVTDDDYIRIARKYVFLGQHEKAYEFLDKLNLNRPYPLYLQVFMKYGKWMEEINKEARFKEIVAAMEKRIEEERARIDEWLEVSNPLY